jgi:vacuolar-type H+-ATPase subunit I/STV1
VYDIFGERVGPKLVQMLEMVSGGMSEVVDEARKAGVVVDEVTIKIADNLDTAFQVALTRIKAGIAETLLFWRPLRQEVEDFDEYQKTIAENEALNKANISSRWGKFTDAQKARFDPERFNAERPVVDQKAAAKAAGDIAKAAERERDAIRESAVLRARINEEAARTDEEREKARIARLYAEMKAAQKAVNDPTDPAQSIAEREQETLRRQLDYERKRAELTEAVEGQSKGKIEKELKAFFNEIDNASPVAARSTRFARSSYEAIGAQVGGASRADISVQGDQLRRINEGIQEVNRNLKSVEVAIETANREPDI